MEVTNACTKACWFCYNHSHPAGATLWDSEELVRFALDCAAHGVKAFSFGGGEPLQYPGLFQVLAALEGTLFRSVTTNGLLLRGELLERLVAARPDKVHVSLHFPEREAELERVIRQTRLLAERGIRSGINFLLQRSKLAACRAAAERIRAAGIGPDRVVYLPMRGQDTPSAEAIAAVAGGPFQSMSCLTRCASSPRFCSVSWDRRVAWCSYTAARRPLAELSYAGLVKALEGLGLEFCGGTDGD